MPRQLTTQDRVVLLLSLVAFLREHGATSVTELARVFEADERLVRRLVSFLGTAGVPGETLSYQHEDLFDIDWDAFEQRDVVDLIQVVAVDDTPRFSSTEVAAMMAGVHTLIPMLPPDMQQAARSASAKLAKVQHIEASGTAVSASVDHHEHTLTVVAEAMLAATQLSFHYRDAAGEVSARRVDPLELTQSGGTWYLRAYCHDREAGRTFLLERIRDPRVLDTPVTVRPSAAPTTPHIELSGGELTATLRVRSHALHRLAGFAPTVVGDAGGGWLRAKVDLLHPAVAIRLVQTAPGEVVVEQPESARSAVSEWVARTLSRYDL